MKDAPDQTQSGFNVSSTTFKLAVAVGTTLMCALLAMLLLQDDTVSPSPPDQTAAMLALIAPSRSAEEPITPLPQRLSLDPRKVALGRQLFSDVRLSRDNTVSCANCHILERSGVDGVDRSFGIGGAQGDRNAPTVFNSGFNFRQFWDGRVVSLEEQVDGPIGNPKEMASDWAQVIGKLASDPVLKRDFAELYPDEGLSPSSVRDAIATFERALITPDAPFDRWLRGDGEALSRDAQAGYALFKSYGCISCHQGANVGGNMFERIGMVNNFFADRGKNDVSDQGRFNLTGEENDRHEFKVPSLRNVELTAPYFHDGSVKTLREAINVMAYYQLGVKPPEQEVLQIEAFLRSLTGARPEVLK